MNLLQLEQDTVLILSFFLKKTMESETRTVTLKIFTFNCWAIGYLGSWMTKDRHERVVAIARYLATAENHYDLVCLQELWTSTDRQLIKEACKQVLPYSVDFYGGVVGTGTMILSKWPIIQTRFKKFTMNGFKHQVWYGDALAGAGIGLAQILVDSDFIVNAYVSHYHAEYNRENDAYKVDRLVQALEAGDFIRWTCVNSDAIVYCGDFNTEPGDLPHRVLTQYYKLSDAQSHLETKLPTCYSRDNSYRNFDGSDVREITIDYVMFKSFLKSKVLNVCRPLTKAKVEATGKSYSDHEALEVDLALTTTAKKVTKNKSHNVTKQEEIQVINQDLLENEIQNALNEELNASTNWTYFHLAGLFLALLYVMMSASYWSVATLFFGMFVGLTLFAFHLIMLSIYLERQCSLKAVLQDLFWPSRPTQQL